MLVELGLVEQRLRAVLEVLTTLNDGASVRDVACRNGVARQTVHRWLRKYASGGLAALADGAPTRHVPPHSTGERCRFRNGAGGDPKHGSVRLPDGQVPPVTSMPATGSSTR